MAGPGMGGGLGEVSGLSGVSGPSASGEVPEPHAAPEERRCGPFVGRATERRAIQRLLSDVHQHRRGALVLVDGPAGVGVRSFVLEAEQICRSVAECVRLPPSDLADAQLAPWGAIVDRIPAGRMPELFPASRATKLTVMVVPDVCAAGSSFHLWLESLLDDLDRHPLLIVIGIPGDRRTDPTELFRRWLGHPNVVHLCLEGLAPDIQTRIVRSRLPGAATDEVAAIVRVASGIPAVATELCRWHEATVAGWEETSDAEALAVAPLLAGRIEASSAARVLEVAAACDGPVHARRVAVLLDEPIDVVRDWLDEAVAWGLLAREENSAVTGYTPGHRLVMILV